MLKFMKNNVFAFHMIILRWNGGSNWIPSIKIFQVVTSCHTGDNPLQSQCHYLELTIQHNMVWLGGLNISMCFIIYINAQGMMTSSNGNNFRVTGHVCGEFTGHRSSGWWFQTPSAPIMTSLYWVSWSMCCISSMFSTLPCILIQADVG